MNIQVFDFDNTLFKVPSFTGSEATGMTPYEWYDNPRSLASDLNVMAVNNVVEMARSTDSQNYLITKRAKTCKDAVIELIEKVGCRFDGIRFLEREDNKGEVLREILNENQQVERITIYEDALWEIIQYVDALEPFSASIRIDFVLINDKKVMKFDWPLAYDIRNWTEVDRLRLSKLDENAKETDKL